MKGTLGTDYPDGAVIVREGDAGACMYVIQSGTVEVTQAGRDGHRSVRVLKAGDFFGEMALFGQEIRTATVRAVGEVKVLRVDKKTLLRRITEDPSLAFQLVRVLASRLREADRKLARLDTDAP